MAAEIWPFSLQEFLQAHAEKFPEKIIGQAVRDKLMAFLYRYLSEGGFPETLNLEIFRDLQLAKIHCTNIL
jgi:predicted AAA+ superfamily ATPase